MKFEIYCNCGDEIYADDVEEAIWIFCNKHNFPQLNSFADRPDYAEEFEVIGHPVDADEGKSCVIP